VVRRQMDYNHYRLHSSLGNVPPAVFAAGDIPLAQNSVQLMEYLASALDQGWEQVQGTDRPKPLLHLLNGG